MTHSLCLSDLVLRVCWCAAGWALGCDAGEGLDVPYWLLVVLEVDTLLAVLEADKFLAEAVDTDCMVGSLVLSIAVLAGADDYSAFPSMLTELFCWNCRGCGFIIGG